MGLIDDVIARRGIARVPLACLPTPLRRAEKLSALLGGPDLWLKRDDLTGFGGGGNKVRALELLLAEALAQKAELLVTGAGVQSNHVRVTAAAAAYAGLEMVAVYNGTPPVEVEGNYRLTRLLGATVHFTGDPERASVEGAIETIAAGLRQQGRRPYTIPRGGACRLGALGYVLAAQELAEQCQLLGLQPTAIVLAIGSGGTQAGLLAGCRLLGLPWRIEGITVSRPVSEARARVYHLAQAALTLLGVTAPLAEEQVIVHDGFLGAGYGIPSPEGMAAIRLIARCEGIFLDPTYSGKALAGLLALIRSGYFQPEETVLFLHTGGEPALFVGERRSLYD